MIGKYIFILTHYNLSNEGAALTASILDFLDKKIPSKKVSIKENTIVCRLGDHCDNLVVLTKGEVKVMRIADDGRHITLYSIHAGESCVLTTSCLFNKKAFPAIAITQADSEGYVISQTQLKLWLTTEPLWQSFIFKMLTERMGDLILKVDQLAFDSLETRLIHWLSAHSQAPCLKITHQQIAQELASSREVISRLLKKLEDKQLIELRRGEIILKKLNAM